MSTADGAQKKRRRRIQDLVGHTMIPCGAEAHPRRAQRGSRASVPIISDGNNQLSALTPRLLNVWRSRCLRTGKRQAGIRACRQKRIECTNGTRHLLIPFTLFSAPCLSHFTHLLAPRARVKMVWCKVKLLIDVLRFAKSGFSVDFFVSQHVPIVCLRSLPFLQGSFLLL